MTTFDPEKPTKPGVKRPSKSPEAKPDLGGDAPAGEVGDVSVYFQPKQKPPVEHKPNGQFAKGNNGGPGNRSLLTNELAEKLFEHLRNGTPQMLSCQLVGIDYSTFCKWRTAEAKGDRPDLTRFFLDYNHARAIGELKLVNEARTGDGREWSHGPAKCAQWLLERTNPKYAPRVNMKIEEVSTLTIDAITKVCSEKDCGCYQELLLALQSLETDKADTD